jgi:ABC-type branched-subunit amino acid transport system substrate-binding protein
VYGSRGCAKIRRGIDNIGNFNEGGSMSRSFTAGVVALVVLTTGVLIGAPAQAQSKSNGASDVGITAKTIRVAVIADVDNSIVPGVLQGIVDGVEGWGRYANATGGIAGRKVQVDFIDSKLNPNDARNAIIKACGEDFALVGTGALLLQTPADEINCPDATGKAIGIPDIAALVTSGGEACAPNAFPIVRNSVDCNTTRSSPQTYRTNNGDSKYLVKKNGKLHGSFVLADDSPSVAKTSSLLNLSAQAAGIKADSSWQVTGASPQSAYTPIISAMKNDSSNFGLSLQAVTGVVLERQEAQLQGLTDPKIVWQCTLACYFDKSFIAAGDAVNNQYMTLGFLPFAETKSNAMDANFVKYVGKSKLSGFASWGFTTGLLFEKAAKEAATKSGGLTRANLMTELKNTHAFNSDGMTATTDIGGKVPSNCFMIEQYKSGKFLRVYPTKQGTFDCKASNLYTFKQDLNAK